MRVEDTKLLDAKLIIMESHEDKRGFFMESYSEKNFKENGIDIDFIQENHSLSTEVGILRGMHFQNPNKAQTKLVRVITGIIYDVIVDIRKGSPTYGMWEGFILSGENKNQLLVPKGFAHGFLTLTTNCNVQYKVDEYYSKEHEGGINFNDKEIGIQWPFPDDKLVLSLKDNCNYPTFKEVENKFIWEEK